MDKAQEIQEKAAKLTVNLALTALRELADDNSNRWSQTTTLSRERAIEVANEAYRLIGLVLASAEHLDSDAPAIVEVELTTEPEPPAPIDIFAAAHAGAAYYAAGGK